MSKAWVIVIVVVVCIGIAVGIYWINASEETKESGREVIYDSYLDFQEDMQFVGGKLDIGRASPGDTVKIYDEIYSIEYDQGNDTTRIRFVSSVSDPKYEWTYALFDGDLTGQFSVGDKVVVIYHITSKDGNDWIDSKAVEHQQ